MAKTMSDTTIGIGMILLVLVSGSAGYAIYTAHNENEARDAPARAAAKQKAEADKADAEKKFQIAVRAAVSLRESMKNPDSFKLEQTLRMADGSLCFSYRATNSFNAITPGYAVYSAGTISASGNAQFQSNWAKHCAGKSGNSLDTVAYALRFRAN